MTNCDRHWKLVYLRILCITHSCRIRITLACTRAHTPHSTTITTTTTTTTTTTRILRVPLIGSIAARIVDCVPVDNKGGRAGGSGSEAIAARLLRMFGKEALANRAAAPQQQSGEEASSSPPSSSTGDDAAAAAAVPAPSRSSTLQEGWARGWKGNPLLLFPEGTTSNGSCLLRFKTGVFAGGVPVHPVTITYGVGRFSPAFERYVQGRTHAPVCRPKCCFVVLMVLAVAARPSHAVLERAGSRVNQFQSGGVAVGLHPEPFCAGCLQTCLCFLGGSRVLPVNPA